MTSLKQIKSNLRRLDINSMIRSVLLDKRVQDFIIELNTRGQPESQLFEEGIDSMGVSLGEYSDFTKQEKSLKGLPQDRVTLFDEGDFYKSFTITIGKDSFTIDANPVKDDTNLFDEWGVDILGLTDENLELITNLLRVKIRPLFIDAVLKNIR